MRAAIRSLLLLVLCAATADEPTLTDAERALLTCATGSAGPTSETARSLRSTTMVLSIPSA